MKHKLNRSALAGVLSPLVIIAITLVFTSVLMLSIGANPLHAYYQLLKGAFGSPSGIINTINKAVPICFAGFAVAVGKKAGIFNIGVEGQLVFGALGSALAGIYLQGLPAFIHIPVSLLAGMLFGMLYALIPSALYVGRGVNLLVIFIMMNNIVNLLITYFVIGPFAGKNNMITATEPIQKSAELPCIITKPNRLSVGIFIVIIVAVLLWFYMNKTTSGYELRACGDNRQAAKYAGISVKGYLFSALMMGGALAGLAGGVEVLGNYHRLYDGFSPGYGFDGIPIAMLANGNPVGVIVGAILFGALRVGSINMQTKAGVSSQIISVIQGVLITLIACEYIIRAMLTKRRSSKQKEVAK